MRRIRLKKVKFITSLIILSLLLVISPTKAESSVSYYLSPSSQTVNPGETFYVDIVLDNSQSDPFITLMSWVNFDPNYLAVIDPGNDGSWITSPDPNISDSAYHATFSFDWHIKNEADNSIGEIDYQEAVGISTPALTSTGTLARITFQALNITPNTSIWFPIDGTPIKDNVVLAEDGFTNLLTSTTDASVNVVPEPMSIMLLGLGLCGLRFFTKKR